MQVGKPYYVCYKGNGKMEYVTQNGYLTYYLGSALRFNTEDEALDVIRISKENYENDEFSYMKSDFNVYEGCLVGEITTTLTELNRTNFAIEELNFSVRTYNSLKRKGINDLISLLSFSKEDVLNIRGINVKTEKEIVDKLNELNFTLREN